MAISGDARFRSLDWLTEMGFSQREILDLNPCVPGEFTLPGAYYVNTGSPRVVYLGTTEGTLPLVAGKWYLIPTRAAQEHGAIRNEAVPVSHAPRLIR